MAASHGADCPAECCLYRRIGAFGLRRSHRCLAISGGPRWSSVRYRPPPSVKKSGSSSRELGSPPEFVVPTSARASKSSLRTTHDHGRLPWGSPTSSRHQRCESTAGGHPRPTYVPPSAFHTLSTGYSSHCLAGLFHPAATSRFRAPGVSSLVPAVPPRRWPVPPRRWRHPPVIGCPMTPADVASTSRS